MGWKENLQPKLSAESLMKDAVTIGLAGGKKQNQTVLKSSSLSVTGNVCFLKSAAGNVFLTCQIGAGRHETQCILKGEKCMSTSDNFTGSC